jgi:hypothetical protein
MTKFKDIIIDTPERFIGKHKNHRISIAYDAERDMYDADVQNAEGWNIMEIIALFEDMKDAIDFCVEYIDKYN